MRLFVALEVPEPPRREVRRRVDAVRDRLPRARWVDLENFHLTLLFLGETAEGDVPALAAGLREAFARCPPLDLRLSNGGTFPPGRPARVAWVGVDAPEELMTLQADVTKAAVEALSFEPEERAYHPHATLARCPDPWRREAIDKFKNAFTSPTGPPFVADHGTLFESKLSPKGARYRAVEIFPMVGPMTGSPE
jgi:RNA 2',3'-cyclic 3'-phosphodiesterase